MKSKLPYILVGILFVLCLGLGMLSYFRGRSIEDLKSQVQGKNEVILVEQLRIDALKKDIVAQETRVASLMDSIKNIKTTVVVKEVESIKYLPLDSSVTLLKENLEKHGELTSRDDTLPSLFTLDQGDTIVAVSGDNVRDMNCIVSRYDWALVENQILGKIVTEDSLIISKKDSIILSKDIILSKQDSIFNENMKVFEKQIKKDKVIAGTVGGALGAATVTAIVLGVILGGK